MTSTDEEEQIKRYQSVVNDIETNNCSVEEIYNRLGNSSVQTSDFPLSNALCGIYIIKRQPPNDDTNADPESLEQPSPAKQLCMDTKITHVCDDPDMKPYPKTDFIIRIHGESLNVNKAVLIRQSDLIRHMSEDGCFDEGQPQELEVDDDEITYDHVVEFLNCIYPGFRQPVSFSNMLQVLPAAEYFETEDLKMSCEAAIEEYIDSVLDKNRISNIPEIVEYLIICDRYNLLNSLDKVTNTACKVPLKWLMAVESFADVSDTVKNKLLTPAQRQTLLDAERKGLKLRAEDLIIEDKNTFYC